MLGESLKSNNLTDRARLGCVIFSSVMSCVIRGATSVLIQSPSAGGGLDQTDNP